MECNRDEALRAKSIAEGKLESKDFAGAKKFALKAQALYPGLDGISQMLTTLDVYVAAENKISGEVDWYAVLSVNPSADDETIRKQYRKLALMLHPDKNKSIGADGAFKLISEAWSLLSDKVKRLAYNQRRSSKGFQQKVSMHTAGSSAPSRTNGLYNFSSRTTSVPKTQNNSAKVPPTSTHTPSSKRTDTFWTICHRCKMHYEYLKMYLNNTLLCPNCKQAFMASETTAPFNFGKLPNQVPRQRQQASSGHAPNQNACDSGKNVPTAQNSCQFPTAQKSGQFPTAQKSGQFPTAQKPGQFPTAQKPGQFPTAQKPGQFPTAQKPGQFPTALKPDQFPTAQKPGQFPTAQKPGQFPTAQKSGQFPAGVSAVRPPHYQQVSLSGKASVSSTDPSIAAKAANVVQQAQDKLKRAYTESQASSSWDEFMKKRRLDEDSTRYGMNHIMAQGNGGYGMTASVDAPGSRIYGFSGANRKPNSTRDLTPVEIRNMLMEKAREEIRSKLNLWSSETTSKAAVKVKDNTKDRKKDRTNSTTGMQGHDQLKNTDFPAINITDQTERGQVTGAAEGPSEEDAEVTMNVPDPDFHDFDNDRAESSFGDNEVWAAYDNDDGMPRFYALVSKVISREPFRLRISWLNSTNTSEFGTMNWVGLGYYKTSGEFRVGRYEMCKSINSFSQKVNWSKGPRGSILILPQKGDVWALYTNWSFDWHHDTPDEVVHKYDMVTVLDDYSEEKGISIAPLVKVVGFRTVFRPNLDPEVIKQIPKEEMLRFSHRVPCHLLTGQEAQNAPKGCLELDPAATPLELLQVITEANDIPVGSNSSNVDEKVLQGVPISSLDKISDGPSEGQAVKIAENGVEAK